MINATHEKHDQKNGFKLFSTKLIDIKLNPLRHMKEGRTIPERHVINKYLLLALMSFLQVKHSLDSQSD